MQTYCEAKEATRARIFLTLLMTGIDGWINNNFSKRFLSNRLKENTRYIIENDDDALADVLTVLIQPEQKCASITLKDWA